MSWSDDDLLAALWPLAASPEEQLAHARTLPSWPLLDEMALELDDELGRVRNRVFDGLAALYVDALLALDAKLEAMSGEENAPLWQAEALTGSDWAEVRELAQRAILLAVPTGPPAR